MTLIPPGVYVHYKGGRYTVLSVAFDVTYSNQERKVVVYRSEETGEWFVREIDEFLETVSLENGIVVKRFAKV
jgi:hypothetical protein